ncbi:glycosyltransferase family 4 protein [Candidatus Dependentiae bacterium]|nr:glycosyltransferase family 4 protein [Candidatus Dependentiae bacterium]
MYYVKCITYIVSVLSLINYLHCGLQQPLVNQLKQTLRKEDHIFILCLTNNKGGIRSHSFGLYSMLENMGFQTTMIIRNNAPAAFEKVKKLNANYLVYTPAENTSDDTKKPPTLTEIYESRHFINFMKKACQKYSSSIIHANFPCELNALYGLKKDLPVKIIYTIHDEDPSWRKNISQCDAVISVSSVVADILKKQHAYNQFPLFYTHPIFDEKPYLSFKPKTTRQDFFKNNFKIDTNNRLICTVVSNYYPCKNHEVAIKAFDLLIKQQKMPACLLLAGYGQTENKCSRLIKKLKLSKHVHMLGYVNDVKSLMYHSDIIINSSIHDSFPITLLEAASLGKPIIATRGTGTNSLVQDGKTGLLFNCHNPNELVNCILQYTHNPDLRKKLARQCHEYLLNNFTYLHNVKNLLAIYNIIKTDDRA